MQAFLLELFAAFFGKLIKLELLPAIERRESAEKGSLTLFLPTVIIRPLVEIRRESSTSYPKGLGVTSQSRLASWPDFPAKHFR